jgi:predicted nucleotidyltransferase
MNASGLLLKKEYNFLRTNPDLEDVIYLMLSGSHGYGTAIESSDCDIRGVLIENKRSLLGLNAFV